MQRLIYTFTFILLLTSCDNPSGPIDIKWDRATCEHCRMVLSDKRFAAQIQGGPRNQVYVFDDFGCAIHWLKSQSWGEEATTKIWVADSRNGQWLDARTAYYIAGQKTPMDHGFGAFATPVNGSVNFQTAKEVILAKSKKHSLE